MDVNVRPVPALDDFLELLARLGKSDLVTLRDDLRAYESGSSPSPHLEEVLRRAECVAEANRIMARFG